MQKEWRKRVPGGVFMGLKHFWKSTLFLNIQPMSKGHINIVSDQILAG